MSGHVFIVEDSTLLAALLGDALRAQGITQSVTTTATGQAFAAKYRAKLASKDAVALIVLDIQLKEESGLDVGRQARAIEREFSASPCPIVFFSARDSDEEIEAAVADCFPARFVHKRDRSGPAQVALEGSVLIRTLFEVSGR